MSLTTPFLCSFLALLLLALACGVHSAPRPGLFSVLADRYLWVFDDPTSLVTFSPSAVVSDLPLHQRVVSAAASSKPGGSFVVVGSQTVAVQRQAHRPFQLAFSFHPDITLYDATYVPTTGVLVAVGVNGSTGWSEVVFFRSEDGGFRWTSSPSQSRTYSTGGSISFSSSGDFGLCALGDSIFRSVDGGRSWVNSTVWNASNGLVTSVAVLDPSLAVVTVANSRGEGTVLISTDAGTTWRPVNSNSAMAAAGSGVVLVDRQTWVVASQSGQIWRTTDGGKTWARTFAHSNTDWTGLAYNSDWGALLAVGYFFNNTGGAGAMALSWDLGGQWLASGSLDKAYMFNRVVPYTPSL